MNLLDLSPVELAFKRFLDKCIKKSYLSYCDYSNIELSEKFKFRGKVYSVVRIKQLLNKVKGFFVITGYGKRRTIKLDTNEIEIGYKSDTNRIKIGYESDKNGIGIGYKWDTNGIHPSFGLTAQSANPATPLYYSILDILYTPLPPKGGVVSSETKKTKAKIQEAPAWPEKFEEFWDIYAYKVGKDKAIRAWNKAIKKKNITSGNIDSILEAAAQYKAYCSETHEWRPAQQHPSRWLNDRTWNDELVHRRCKTRDSPVTAATRLLDLAGGI